jgi:hypothetical protein
VTKWNPGQAESIWGDVGGELYTLRSTPTLDPQEGGTPRDRMLRSLLAFVAGLLPLQAAYSSLMKMAVRAMELDLLPDFVIRRGIRFLLSRREAEVRDVGIAI